MGTRNHHGGEDSHASDLLADISLNSLGLVLIVLLVYMILFHQTTSAVLMAQQTKTQAEPAGRSLEENRQLKQQVQDLQDRLRTRTQEDGISGLWSFQIHVTELVDHNGRAEPADFVVDYFVWLDIKGESVRGSLFGVKEHDQTMGSASHANITGVCRGDDLKLELAFTGVAQGGTEVFVVKKQGDRFVGELRNGKGKVGHWNYRGPAIGSPLTESVFSS
jgi:hypothetical protein